MQKNNKVLVIISTPDPDKARTGMMYAVNALQQGWMEDVQLYFFGPSEQMILKNPELQGLLTEFQASGKQAVACSFIADEENINNDVAALGIDVTPVGSRISALIREGYIPMIW